MNDPNLSDQDISDYINSLPPDQQQEAMVSLGLIDANQVPYTFGGANAPALDASSLQGAQYTGGYNIPLLTAKGKVDPRDLAQVATSVNLAKNREGLLADNAFTAQAGLGAYGTGAFDPTVKYGGSVVDFPGERTLTALAQTGGWQGQMAKYMLGIDTPTGQRMSPSQAMSAIMTQLKADPAKLSPDAKALQDDIFSSLQTNKPSGGSGGQIVINPDGTVGQGGTGKVTTTPGPKFDPSQFDTYGMTNWANDRYLDLVKDQPKDQLFQDPQTGAYYNQAPVVTPSTQAKWFQDRGLDLPTASYADPTYQENVFNAQDPGRPAANQQAGQDYALQQAAVQQLGQRATQRGDLANQFEQSLADYMTNQTGFVDRQRTQNAIEAAGPRTVPPGLPIGSMPDHTVIQARPQGVASSAGTPTGPAAQGLTNAMSQLPENRQPPVGQRGGGGAALKTGNSAPTPTDSELTKYYVEQFPIAPLQVNPQTGQNAPVYDFGGGAIGNAGMQDVLDAMAGLGAKATGGSMQPFSVDYGGGQKGTVVPGGRSVQPTQARADALRTAAGQARTNYTDAYNNAWRNMIQTGGGLSANFPGELGQRATMSTMAAQGRSPLQDELMQRRLLLNSLGLYS